MCAWVRLHLCIYHRVCIYPSLYSTIHYTDWKTDANFYWPLDKVTNGTVSGSTIGLVNGDIVVVGIPILGKSNVKRNALSFDGKINHVILPGLQGTCASNPDASTCLYGFTMSFLFCYDEENSLDIKYVADNMGQGNVATLGYKVFIKLGHMFVIVLGHEYVYTEYIQFNRSVWNHFAFTWAPLKGLSLYLNGNKT